MSRPLKVQNVGPKTLTNGNKKCVIAFDPYDNAWTVACWVDGKREVSQDIMEDDETTAVNAAKKWLEN
jgi:hypothetical protein